VDDYVKTYICKKCKSRDRVKAEIIHLECKCGHKIDYPISVVKKVLARKNITLKEYVGGFKCQKCEKTWGKKANPIYANIPKEITCGKCSKKVKINIYQLKAKADKNNTTIDELIRNFKCQSCCPCHRGRSKKIQNN
jgi:kynurenine formamidase